MKSFDAIVVGGGHNGLVAAAVLGEVRAQSAAARGRSRSSVAPPAPHDFAPGFRVSPVAHLLNRLHPEVVAALELERHGLDIRPGGRRPFGGAFGRRHPADAPRRLWRAARRRRRRRGRRPGRRCSGAASPLFRHLEAAACAPTAGARGIASPTRSALGPGGLSLRRLGKEDMRDFLRDAADECRRLLSRNSLTTTGSRGLLAFDAVLGSHLGPRSPTSLLGLYYRLTGEMGGVPGGSSRRRAAWAR